MSLKTHAEVDGREPELGYSPASLAVLVLSARREIALLTHGLVGPDMLFRPLPALNKSVEIHMANLLSTTDPKDINILRTFTTQTTTKRTPPKENGPTSKCTSCQV